MCGEHSRRDAEITEHSSRSRAQQPSCTVAYPESCHCKYNMKCYIYNDDQAPRTNGIATVAGTISGRRHFRTAPDR
jgi:hypothetical protein